MVIDYLAMHPAVIGGVQVVRHIMDSLPCYKKPCSFCCFPRGICSSYVLMRDWPHTIPYDLACGLIELDRMRFTTADQDRWAVFREWLTKHGVPAPKELPVRPNERHEPKF